MENMMYVPELNYRFAKYWNTLGEMPLKSYVQIPEIIETGYRNDNSIIRLLFDSTHALYDDNVNYMFKSLPLEELPKNILRRIKGSNVYDAQCSIIVDNNVPGSYLLYPFVEDESLKPIYLKLLEYRQTSTTSIDENDYPTYGDNLEKMVYMYLNLVVNGLYDILDVDQKICDDDDFELYRLYEIYLMNEAYRYLKTWSVFMDTGLVDLRYVRVKYAIPENFEDVIIITTDLPHDTTQIEIYKDGEKINTSLYNATSYTNYCSIEIDSQTIGLKRNDTLIIDYYTNQEILT